MFGNLAALSSYSSPFTPPFQMQLGDMGVPNFGDAIRYPT